MSFEPGGRTGGMQTPGVGSQTSSPRSTSNQQQAVTKAQAQVPYDKMPHVSMATIVEIHKDEAKVQVRIVGEKEKFANGAWIPVIQSIETIYLLFGQLRKGMIARVFWQGKNPREARWGYADVVGEETSNALKQQMHHNEVESSPYKFTSGGLTSFG